MMQKTSDHIDLMLSTLLEESIKNDVEQAVSTEIYQLPIRVGIKNKSLDEGDKPWVVGHFAPGKYLNDTHPQGHDGVDLKAPAKTLIYPIASGTVFEVKEMPKGGKTCKISHEDGSVVSYYAHMSQVLVQPQQKVNQKTPIGVIGDTGNAKGRGEHLHYEVKSMGQKIDPMSIVGKQVGKLSQKKQAEWDNFFSGFLKNAIFSVPRELHEKIFKHVVAIFATKTYEQVDFKIKTNLRHKNLIKKYIELIKNIPHSIDDILSDDNFPLTAKESIKFENDLVFDFDWKIEKDGSLYSLQLYLSYLDKEYVSENISNISEKAAERIFFEYIDVLYKCLIDLEIYESVDMVELNLLKKHAEKYSILSNDKNWRKIFKYKDLVIELNIGLEKPNDTYGGEYLKKGDIHRILILIPSPKYFDIENINSFNDHINILNIRVRHELQHAIQDEKTEDNRFYFGNAGKKERSKIYDLDGIRWEDQNSARKLINDEEAEKNRQKHSLRDIEFYPRLSDSIYKFNEMFGNYPLPIKEAAAKVWIGLPNNYHGKVAKLFLIDTGFLDLMKNYHLRWRKAVKQFWKAVFDDEIKIQAEDKNDGFEKNAGLVKVPDYLINEITEFVHAYFAERVYKNIRNITGDLEIERLKILTKKIVNNFNIQNFIDFDDGIGDFFYQKHKIIVEVRIGKYGGTGGFYENSFGRHYIRIHSDYLDDIKNIEIFKDELSDLRRIINHELIHMFQEMYKKEFKLNNFYGLPGREFSSKENNPFGYLKINEEKDKEKTRLIHELRDIEFYPRLADAIERFNRKYKNYPEKLKKEIAKIWVCANIEDEQISILQNNWFKTLKNKNFSKYKKAVKEFWKAIFE